MGVLFHKKYFATPEIWRIKPGQSDTRSTVLSSLLGVLSCAAFLAFGMPCQDHMVSGSL